MGCPRLSYYENPALKIEPKEEESSPLKVVYRRDFEDEKVTQGFTVVDPAGQFSSPYTGMGNNPVMMVDPTGEIAFLAVAAIVAKGALIGAGVSGAAYGISTVASGNAWNWGDFGSALGSGAIAGGSAALLGPVAGGMLSGGINAGINGGDIGQGVLYGGLGGMVGAGFADAVNINGIIPGAAYGAATGGLTSGGLAALQGGDFWTGFEQGAIAGGIGGGLQGGINAAKSNRSLLTGNKLYRDRKTGASLQMDPKLVEEYLADGFTTPDGEHISRNEFELTFNKDKRANGRYMGFKDGKHHVNLDIGSYETTIHNVKALMVHELYGHGIMGYSNVKLNHHKAYFASIDSKYWGGTTSAFKAHTVNRMWEYYSSQVGGRMPMPYHNIFWKYQTLYK